MITPFSGDQHQLVTRKHFLDRHHVAGLFGDAEIDHARAAATLEAILVDIRTLATPLCAHDQQRRLRRRFPLAHHHPDHDVILAQAHTANTRGDTAHVPHVALVEPDRHALPGGQYDLVVTRRDLHVDQLIIGGRY